MNNIKQRQFYLNRFYTPFKKKKKKIDLDAETILDT